MALQQRDTDPHRAFTLRAQLSPINNCADTHNTYTFRQCFEAFDPSAGVSLQPLGSRTFSNVTSNRVVKSELSLTIRISFSVSSSAELNGHGCIQAMPSYRRIIHSNFTPRCRRSSEKQAPSSLSNHRS
jgi:hypothetical protein